MVTPVLLEMVQQSNSTPCDPVDMSALLNKEACMYITRQMSYQNIPSHGYIHICIYIISQTLRVIE